MSEAATDDKGRPEPPLEGGEVATLRGFLDYQRATLDWKCRGLTDEQLRISLPPTSMTLGGLLKHLALVEDYWFTEVVGEAPRPETWAKVGIDSDPEWEWKSAAGDSGEELRFLWATAVRRSDAVLDAQLETKGDAALAAGHPAWGGEGRVSLRWVLAHMVEEYARHNGHADLLRESIDGETGE